VNEKFVVLSKIQDTPASFHCHLDEVGSNAEEVDLRAVERSSACIGSE